MTDSDIIEIAKIRFDQLKRSIGLKFGDFDIFIAKDIIAKAIVHNGELKYIEVPDNQHGCRKKIFL